MPKPAKISGKVIRMRLVGCVDWGVTMNLFLCDGKGALNSVPVLWIRIRSDPHHFTGSGSVSNSKHLYFSTFVLKVSICYPKYLQS
jgi:hypothetical protein